jgi:hypothetical protein
MNLEILSCTKHCRYFWSPYCAKFSTVCGFPTNP